MLETLDATQRMDVDTKVESLHKHWTQLKNIAKIRLELATLYIRFLDDSESLEKVFNEVELILRTNANEDSLKQIEKAWAVIKPSFAEIKMTGGRVVADLEKVSLLCAVAWAEEPQLMEIYLCNRSRTHISIGKQSLRQSRRFSTASVSDSSQSRRVATTGPRS